jgi:hypothetical protein
MVQNSLLFFEALLEAKLVGVLATGVAMGVWVAIGAGVAAISAGVTWPLAGSTLTGIAGICLGASLIGAGVAAELIAAPLFGTWLIVAGISLVGLAGARLRDRWYVLGGVAAVGLGISLAILAAGFFLGGELLGGIAAVGAGVALAIVGAGIIIHPSQAQLRRWSLSKWAAWTQAPDRPHEEEAKRDYP